MTVKENVKALYKRFSEERWGRFIVYPNEVKTYGGHCGYYDPDKEECPADAIHTFIDGTVLSFNGSCTELTAAQRDAIISLGFEPKDQCFWCYEYPGSGGLGYSRCHIRYAGRELTSDELWLTDLKQRAIDLGYDVRDSAEAIIGWGIYGDTKEESYSNFISFRDATGVIGSATRYDYGSGYIWATKDIYANSLYGITEPVSAPFGDITKVTLDDKLLPESGTLTWLLNDDAHVKVFFKNTGNVASAFHIWLTDETGTTITGCDITTAEIPADGTEYFVDLCVFVPDVVKVKTLTAHIES